MSNLDEIGRKVGLLVGGLELREALSTLHYVSRVLQHRSDGEFRSLWIPGASGEPSAKERALGRAVIGFLEREMSAPVKDWDAEALASLVETLAIEGRRIARAALTQDDRIA